MSIIGVWAPKHGAGNTLNTIAVSAMLAMQYEYRILVTQTQSRFSTLEYAFIKANEASLNRLVHSRLGLDELERLAKSRRLTEKSIENQAVILEKNRLDLLIGTERKDDQSLLGMKELVTPILRMASKAYDAVIVDLHAGSHVISDEILEQSDLIIISLMQNKPLLDRFFDQDYERFKDRNHVLVIGQYDPDSKYSLKNIKRHYKLSSPIFTIPYDVDFQDAFNDSDVLGWFRRNKNQASAFNRELKKITDYLASKVLKRESPEEKGA